MDDHLFDKKIKAALSEYEAPGFDPDALSAFRRRVDAAQPAPWHRRLRTELLLLLSGMAVCTLLIMWYLDHTRNVSALSTLQLETDLLREELVKANGLLSLQPPSRIDTIILQTNTRPYAAHITTLLNRIAQLELQMRKQTSEPIGGVAAYMEDGADEEGLHNSSHHRLVPRRHAQTSMRALPLRASATGTGVLAKRLPVSSMRDIEKHYHDGVGIYVGPTAELSVGFYREASGAMNGSAGVLADFIWSPWLSAETGIKFLRRYYEVDNINDARLPSVDESMGPFQLAEIDTWGLEIPLNLKYRYPIDLRTHALVGAGYSANVYFKQLYEYQYDISANNNFVTGSEYETSKIQFYPGTFNAIIGMSRSLKNHQVVEGSLFFQKGLGRSGIEGVTPHYLGLRATYWFRYK